MLNQEMSVQYLKHANWPKNLSEPYFVKASEELRNQFSDLRQGITGTAPGFYGPQGRVLRLPLKDSNLNTKLDNFSYKDYRITNFEMETSVIYGLSKLLGHEALSLNAIIANRANGDFSKDPKKTVDKLILYALERIVNI